MLRFSTLVSSHCWASGEAERGLYITLNSDHTSARTKADRQADVQGQIYALATALGVKPADLSSAIRPLIDPTVPNPAEACQKELELVKLQLQTGATAGDGATGNKVDKEAAEGSLLGMAAEALLD